MIPVFKPLIGEPELSAAQSALEMGWLGMGSYVADFERGLAELLQLADGRGVAAVSTGHAALHLGLLLAGVGPGDEVITPAFNNVSDFQAIMACGANPVFCDIDEKTLCIDLDKAEELITPRVKAMIVMDYFCMLCDHDRVAKIAAAHGIRIVHDAAHSLGSDYSGRRIGSFSDICMFSFDPIKTVTTIDGGALVVRSEEELARLHEMRMVGMSQPKEILYQNQRAWTYDVTQLGFRYHMANLHAAIGLAQLSRFADIAVSRRAAGDYYTRQLIGIQGLIVPEPNLESVVPFLYYIRVPANVRDELRSHMRNRGVDTGIHWKPGNWYSLFEGCRQGDLSVTNRVAREIISIPLYSGMSEDSLDKVVYAIRSFFAER